MDGRLPAAVLGVLRPLDANRQRFRVGGFEQQLFDIPCKIIENLLHSKERDLSSDELKALYIDFKTRNPNLKAGTKELKDALRSDRYFNTLRIKFGYAVTCHKAQGGEWKRAFINCKTAMGYFNASYFRWLYTGITRAKENLFTNETTTVVVHGFAAYSLNNKKQLKAKLSLNIW